MTFDFEGDHKTKQKIDKNSQYLPMAIFYKLTPDLTMR